MILWMPRGWATSTRTHAQGRHGFSRQVQQHQPSQFLPVIWYHRARFQNCCAKALALLPAFTPGYETCHQFLGHLFHTSCLLEAVPPHILLAQCVTKNVHYGLRQETEVHEMRQSCYRHRLAIQTRKQTERERERERRTTHRPRRTERNQHKCIKNFTVHILGSMMASQHALGRNFMTDDK